MRRPLFPTKIPPKSRPENLTLAISLDRFLGPARVGPSPLRDCLNWPKNSESGGARQSNKGHQKMQVLLSIFIAPQREERKQVRLWEDFRLFGAQCTSLREVHCAVFYT